MVSKQKNFFKVGAIVLLFLVFSCDNNSHKKEMEKLISTKLIWAKEGKIYYYTSDKNDSLSFKITNFQTERSSGGSGIGAPDFFESGSYKYKATVKSVKSKELISYFSHVNRKVFDTHIGYTEFKLNFLDSNFDLLNSKNTLVKKHKFANTTLDDVYLLWDYHPEIEKNVTKIWYSYSKGIVKFITKDGKTWSLN